MMPLESDAPAPTASVPHRLPRWTGRVIFGSTRYNLPAIYVTVDARTPHVAARLATTMARLRLPKGTRVTHISISLERLPAGPPGGAAA